MVSTMRTFALTNTDEKWVTSTLWLASHSFDGHIMFLAVINIFL